MRKNLKYIFDNAKPEDIELIACKLGEEPLESAQLDQIKNKVYSRTKLKRKNTKNKLRYWAIGVAACLCVAVGLGALAPSLQKKEIMAATLKVGEKLIGKPALSVIYERNNEEVIDDNPYEDWLLAAPEFRLNTVIEAEIIEVYPDLYRDSSMGTIWGEEYTCHVARVRVLDSLRGSGFPEEIFISYTYYGTDIFDGYERFIMSLSQVGVEDYVLINDTEGRIDYFTNMFEVAGGDIGYGGVIAFNDGIVDDSFWEKANRMEQLYPKRGSLMKRALDDSDTYPAKRGSTIREVKGNLDKFRWNIFNLFNTTVQKMEQDYITEDDLFCSDEAKDIRSYLEPDGKSVFKHMIAFTDEGVKVKYTRLINGLETDEEIVISGDKSGGVTRYGEGYTREELEAVPVISEVIERLDLTKLSPPSGHPVITGYDIDSINAGGVYRKIDGEIYGIIRVLWKMSDGRKNMRDALYYLYDESGEGSTVSQKKLKSIIGDDKLFTERIGVEFYHFY